MKILFDEDYEGIADTKVESTLKYAYSKQIDIHTSNEIVILCARVLIAEGVFDKDKVEFFVNGDSIGFSSKYGILDEYPDEICVHDDLLDRILEVR